MPTYKMFLQSVLFSLLQICWKILYFEVCSAVLPIYTVESNIQVCCIVFGYVKTSVWNYMYFFSQIFCNIPEALSLENYRTNSWSIPFTSIHTYSSQYSFLFLCCSLYTWEIVINILDTTSKIFLNFVENNIFF